ncbi:STAS domain-containing protein [Amycolatopsis anabasis]|uniref:STAS domain-containing protein n=1 Tax=Amycolatopsis anabasis TaxID=1840409 RepID=UPI00131E1D20|nr:STAS domain-containing protein [Amycolatopsis anabasis]
MTTWQPGVGEPAERPTEVFAVAAQRCGAAIVLRVAGEVDLVTAPELEEALIRAQHAHPEILVVDLSEVTFLGSVGLEVLFGSHLRVTPRTQLRIVAPSRATWRPLEITGLGTELAVYPNLDEALSR